MKNYYRIETAKGRSHEEIMEIIWKSGRDNSRTPMQWNAEENAGFTTGTPWMKINPNYKEINVEKQLNDPDSIYSFYKKMIEIRKQHEVFVYGDYELLLEDHPTVYAYTRSLKGKTALIICNFTIDASTISLPEFKSKKGKLLLKNYNDATEALTDPLKLNPYETRVYLFQ
jgi:alpha-glucosidase